MSQQPAAPSVNLRGAVDLSSLARPAGQPGQPGAGAAPGAPGAQGGGTVPGPYSLTLTEASLPAVMETSAQVPVVLVVTSARAPGSDQLADDLADIARETGGRFQVARVDSDTETGFVSALGITAVPSVLALLAGQPMPLFQGTADRAQVASIMDQVLEVAAQNGIAGRVDGEGGDDAEAAPVEEPIDPNMQAGMDAIEAGDLDAAAKHFEKAAIENPRGDEPREALAQVHLMQRVTGHGDPEQALAAAAQAAPDDVDAHLAAADVELTTGRVTEALERVLALVTATRGEQRETARLRLVELFDVVGSGSPQVASVRRRLASALY